MIRSKELADEVRSVYESGKGFFYDHVCRCPIHTIDKAKDAKINIKVDAQRRYVKGLLLLFLEPYTAGTRDSEKFVFPDLKKVKVTINGSPNMLYNNGIETQDIWKEVGRFFMKEKHKPQHMTLKKFYTENKFGLLINLRSMASQKMHGSGTRLVNTTDGIQLEIDRDLKGSGTVNCHIFVISDSQFNILNKQLESVQY